MNVVLHRIGYPILDIPYARRAGYHCALERAQVKKDEAIFVRWFLKRYLAENSRYQSTRGRGRRLRARAG